MQMLAAVLALLVGAAVSAPYTQAPMVESINGQNLACVFFGHRGKLAHTSQMDGEDQRSL